MARICTCGLACMSISCLAIWSLPTDVDHDSKQLVLISIGASYVCSQPNCQNRKKSKNQRHAFYKHSIFRQQQQRFLLLIIIKCHHMLCYFTATMTNFYLSIRIWLSNKDKMLTEDAHVCTVVATTINI